MALAAQGFAAPRRHDGRAIRRLFDRVALVQIDSVNVLSRAHYLPGFARLGAYDRDGARPRRPLRAAAAVRVLGPRGEPDRRRAAAAPALADGAGARRGVGRHAADRAASSRSCCARSSSACATRARSRRATSSTSARKRSGPWWDWSDSKRAIEMLFWGGEVTSARRRNFERLYDLPERVLPRAVLDAPTPDEADAQRELVAIAARALGVAALPELRDYFRLPADGDPPARRRAGGGGRAAAGRGRGLGRPGLAAPRRPHPAAASTRGRCSARSTTCCGSGGGSSGCSASASSSRSTSRSPSASTATTCCRSCSATGSWRASTSRPTARPGGCSRTRCTSSRTRRRRRTRRCAEELALLAGWLGLTPGES